MFGRKGDTMDTYYEDILKKVEMQMEQHDHQAAYQILEEELSMPYIPKEYEHRLQFPKHHLLRYCMAIEDMPLLLVFPHTSS